MYFFFFSIWVFFQEHSRFTVQQGKGEAISLSLLITSTHFTDTQKVVGRLIQKTHFRTQPAAGLEPGTFGFRAQVANHKATCLNVCMSSIGITSLQNQGYRSKNYTSLSFIIGRNSECELFYSIIKITLCHYFMSQMKKLLSRTQ